MQHRETYIMQDQIQDCVTSIMTCNPRKSKPRETGLPRNLVWTALLTGLYILALASSE